MEIRVENSDLKGGVMEQLRKDAMDKLAIEEGSQHYFSIYYRGICVAYGIMPKEFIIGTLHLGDGVSLNFHTEPIDLTQKDSHSKRGKRNK